MWLIEDELEKCSEYVGEDEFIKEREKEKMIRKLSK